MKIVVTTRCRNEERNIPGFLHGYDFADVIVVADGGSDDNSIPLLTANPKVDLRHYDGKEYFPGHWWNPDNPHINFAIDAAKEHNPDWIILDDMDCYPNYHLRNNAREIISSCSNPQINVFRLYMWGNDQFFPYMNRDFDPAYRSFWAWQPSKVNIYADNRIKHGTILGMSTDIFPVELPSCLLHMSWNPETIEKKLAHYLAVGIDMGHPYTFAGEPAPIPDWAIP